MKKLLFISMMLLLAGCGANTGREMPFTPGSMPQLPTGSPEYTQGWKDGCQSGMAVYGDNTYKMLYKWVQDQDLVRNEVYYKAWKDSYNYCRHFLQTFNNSFTTPSTKFLPFDDDSKDPLFDNSPDFLALPGETSFGNYGSSMFGDKPTDDFMGFNSKGGGE